MLKRKARSKTKSGNFYKRKSTITEMLSYCYGGGSQFSVIRWRLAVSYWVSEDRESGRPTFTDVRM